MWSVSRAKRPVWTLSISGLVALGLAAFDASAQSPPKKVVQAPAPVSPGAVAATVREDLSLLQDREVQRGLIVTGFLDAEIGGAPIADVREAVARFRRSLPNGAATNPQIEIRAPLAERAKLAEAFFRFTRHVSPANGLKIDLPLAFLDPSKERGTSNSWREIANPLIKMDIDLFTQPLKFDTAPSLLAGHFRRYQGTRLDQFRFTANEFTVEGEGSYFNSNTKFLSRVVEYSNELRGLYVRYSKEPPSAFTLPDFILPAIKVWLPGTATEGEKRQLGWNLIAGASTNIMVSGFAQNNGWTQLSTGPCKKPAALDEPDGKQRSIVFATTRTRGATALEGTAISDGDATLKLFGAQRDTRLHVGCSLVHVPNDVTENPKLVMAKAGTPSATVDRRKHYVIDDIRVLESLPITARGPYFSIEDQRPAQTGGRALLYVHGFNNSFRDALLRGAQVAENLGYGGRVYVFSWPSNQATSRYFDDLDNAEQAEIQLQQFIRAIMEDSNIQRLDVIAHSMGSQPTLRALANLRGLFDQRRGTTSRGRFRLGQLVFASPDVSTPVFQSKVSELVPFADRVTVYVSSADCALSLASNLRWGTPRAGYKPRGANPVFAEGVQVIDTTGLRAGGTWWNPLSWCRRGHADFAEQPEVIKDLGILFKQNNILRDRTERAIKGEIAEKPYDASKDPSLAGKSYWLLLR
jgi:esterase/lipase superfamily enzyme